MKKIALLFAVVSILFTTACSDYNRIVKGDDYQSKFKLANELYDRGQELRAVPLYEQVYQRMPKTSEGEVSYYRLGKAFFVEEDWYMAGYYLGSFAIKFPYSTKCEETQFLSALCAVQNSPEASLDQTDTELALNDLQLFVQQYPNSSRIDTCNKIMNRLRFKLQTKEVLNVRLYSRTENFRAAVISAQAFLESYPISVYREEVYMILVKNSYLLAINSIESKKEERRDLALDRIHNFLAEFPNSDYLREFESYSEKLQELPIEYKAQ